MYQALYRKYRPKDFDSVVGQSSLVTTLRNSVKNKSFSHAYMFFGPRGTGKTTLSKIFARTVNCLNPIDGNACCSCKNCLYTQQRECVDIIEMDAASNNGVDEIRELKNKINLVPAELNYKVYIIDEVHMLSIGAFNALLKTLEEPPEHAIFILATTDPQKVPATIISRCQCFSFKRISEKDIVNRLRYICDIEHIETDDDVLREIAVASDGGMRDALGLLDKLHVFVDGKISMDAFIELNGLITKNDLQDFANFVFSGDSSNVLKTISSYNDSGKNIIQVISQLMNYLRDVLLSYYIDKVDIQWDANKVIKLVSTINEKMFDIKKSGNPVIYVEMLLLEFVNAFIKADKIISREIISDPPNTTLNRGNFHAPVSDNVEDDTSTLSAMTEISDKNVVYSLETNKKDDCFDVKNDNNTVVTNEETLISNNSNNGKIINILEIMEARVNNTLATADKGILNEVINSMKIFNDYTFDENIGYIACALLDAKVRAASSESIIISYDYDSIVKQNLLFLDKITSVFNNLTNSNKKFAIITDEEWEKERAKYVLAIKEGKKYSVVKEPEEKVFEDKKENDIIVGSAIELFGDIVEVE